MLKEHVTVSEQALNLPAHLWRRVRMPAVRSALTTLLMAAISLLFRRKRVPAMPRMSERWLRGHDLDAGRHDDWSGY